MWNWNYKHLRRGIYDRSKVVPILTVTALNNGSAPRGEILLVEDNPLLRMELARGLVKLGHAVLEAKNSSDALRAAREGRIRIMVLDTIDGDDLNGVDLAKELHGMHPDAPVIFIGGIKKDANALRRARRAGLRVEGNLEKPIAPKDLARRIDQALEVSQAEEDRSLKTKKVDSLMEITAQIDKVYDEIISLIAKRKGEPDLKELIAPLRDKLEELQEKQANAMEHHFHSQLLYDPRQGRRIINQAKKLLGKR